MWAALVSTAFSLGLSTFAAKGDEAKISLDHPFALVDAEGKSVTSVDFRGKWLLIYFGYTHCSDQCPTALSAMAEALDEIGPAAGQIQPLFITVDPERDRGPMLRNFTAAFDQRLIGLTGTREQITDIAHALGVKYERCCSTTTIMSSTTAARSRCWTLRVMRRSLLHWPSPI
jgi:protein SCO1